MALKTASSPDTTFGSLWEGALPDSRIETTSAHTSLEGPGGEPIPLPVGAPLHGGFDSDDYHIALVPHERLCSVGFNLRLSTVSPVFVLPLTWRELMRRVRAEFSPAESQVQNGISRFGHTKVNFLTMHVTSSEKRVELTAQEFKLLRFLTHTPDRVFSRNELLNEVWGYHDYPSTRTVDNHICSLRRKLETNPARPVHFLTVRRIGYKFVP